MAWISSRAVRESAVRALDRVLALFFVFCLFFIFSLSLLGINAFDVCGLLFCPFLFVFVSFVSVFNL